MTKAVHEAKVNLSWINPNAEYVEALSQFIDRILASPERRRRNNFWKHFTEFLPLVSFFGAMNSLAQTLLKITCPGVPDIYQGNELWDFSLVDPDNRRPIDFQRRERMLAELLTEANRGDLSSVCEMRPPLASVWDNTELQLPRPAPTHLLNVFSGEVIESQNGTLLCREIFRSFPLALLAAR